MTAPVAKGESGDEKKRIKGEQTEQVGKRGMRGRRVGGAEEEGGENGLEREGKGNKWVGREIGRWEGEE